MFRSWVVHDTVLPLRFKQSMPPLGSCYPCHPHSVKASAHTPNANVHVHIHPL